MPLFRSKKSTKFNKNAIIFPQSSRLPFHQMNRSNAQLQRVPSLPTKIAFKLCLFLPLLLPVHANFSSVCQFPKLEDWLGCQREMPTGPDGAEAPLNGWFCDPQSSMSMSEVWALDDSVRRLYSQHGANCVCPTATEPVNEFLAETVPTAPTHCWHRFAFAFVRQLGAPGSDVLSADQCLPAQPTNESSGSVESMEYHEPGRFELPPDWESEPEHAFASFAQNFASVLRQRWALGQCGEDLLLLVVQRPPVQQISAVPYSSASSRLFGPLPMLFVAPGPLVLDRLGPQLDQLVLAANSQLQRDGRPLFRVLADFVQRVGSALSSRSIQVGTQQRHRARSHVPLWAWAVFGACGVAFGLMALGLFLIRTGTRRSTASAGQQQGQGHGGMARRHWKEGEEQPQAQTYVNLVQMLMPHPKPPPTNMPQQV